MGNRVNNNQEHKFAVRKRDKAIERILFILLLLSFVLLTACSGKHWRGWEGRLTKPDNRIVLNNGGPHAGIWQTNDLAIHYRYAWEEDRLVIQGQVKRQARIRYFHRLQAWVWIHFLDTNGYVLASRRLWAQNGSDVYGQIRYRYHQNWQLPAGSRAVGFSYSGRARDHDVWWDFWQLP